MVAGVGSANIGSTFLVAMILSGPVQGANSSGLAMSGGGLSLQGLARLNGFEFRNAFYHEAPQINQISRLGVSVLFKL
jgi:hypothetical protein